MQKDEINNIIFLKDLFIISFSENHNNIIKLTLKIILAIFSMKIFGSEGKI